MSRVGLFGGSFNPVHHGHLIVARALAEQLELSRVLLLPTAHPPHKQRVSDADAAHRAEMLRLAVAGDALFEINDYDLRRPGPTYTIDTVDHFASRMPGVRLHWIIGSDSLCDLVNWRRAAELVDRCEIVTAQRPGAPEPDWNAFAAVFSPAQIAKLRAGVLTAPLIDIAASDIRRRVGLDLPIRYLVPEAVAEYIRQHRLYPLEA